MSNLFIEIQVPDPVAEAICRHFADILDIFNTSAKAAGYKEVSLTVTAFKASTEEALIKLSDPYTRSWTNLLMGNMSRAWVETAKELGAELDIGKPTMIFSISSSE